MLGRWLTPPHQEPRTKNQEPRTKNQEPRTKNQEPRSATRYAPTSFFFAIVAIVVIQCTHANEAGKDWRIAAGVVANRVRWEVPSNCGNR